MHRYTPVHRHSGMHVVTVEDLYRHGDFVPFAQQERGFLASRAAWQGHWSRESGSWATSTPYHGPPNGDPQRVVTPQPIETLSDAYKVTDRKCERLSRTFLVLMGLC